MNYDKELAKQNISSREKLMKMASKVLGEGRNVVIIGPFGIGKTHYCSSVAKAMGVTAIRISVLEDSRNMAITLLRKWCDEELKTEARKRKRSEIFALRQNLHVMSLPRLKYEIQLIHNKTDYLLIVDDVLKIPRPKLVFIGFLADSGFRIIAAVEARCDENTLLNIRVKCQSSVRVFLPRLTTKESQALILSLSQSFGLSLSESEISWYATTYRGYPLMIVEGMKRREARNKEA